MKSRSISLKLFSSLLPTIPKIIYGFMLDTVIAVNVEGTHEEVEQTPPWTVIALGAGCVMLLIVCVVQRATLKRKIRKLEEDKL